jgi:pimeloyl-ACP methyl ester carboxylesterase
MLTGRSSAFPKTNWRDRLKEISQPTLIIAGAQDNKFVDASQYIHRLIPHSQLAIISGAGHMVNLEKPDEFNQAVINFLE